MPSQSASSGDDPKVRTGAIAGGVVGGVILIASASLLTFFIARRNRRNGRTSEVAQEPYRPMPHELPVYVGHNSSGSGMNDLPEMVHEIP